MFACVGARVAAATTRTAFALSKSSKRAFPSATVARDSTFLTRTSVRSVSSRYGACSTLNCLDSSLWTPSRSFPPSPTRLFITTSASPSTEKAWKVPDYVRIPRDRLDWSFVRSSGAGGQNVNKVNTQVQVRFHVVSADWVGPYEVRQRLLEQEASRVNKEGYLVLRVQEHRTQTRNRELALEKLQEMVLKAWPRPVVRKKRTGISKKTKEQRKEFKRRRSQLKESRRRVDFD